jgi:hypothetical protein
MTKKSLLFLMFMFVPFMVSTSSASWRKIMLQESLKLVKVIKFLRVKSITAKLGRRVLKF